MADGSWYIDESDPRLARWHDGVGWTDHVVTRAAWEGLGAPPPPLDRPQHLVRPARLNRGRVLAGSAAVVALLLVGGAVLLRDDGGDSPEAEQTAGQLSSANRVAGPSAAAWLRLRASLTDEVRGAASLVLPDEVSEPDDDSAEDEGSSVARSTGSRTPAAPSSSGSVRRTETATHTHTDPGPTAVISGGDKSSVGNSTATTIQSGYVPPPTTTTVAPEPTATTAAPPETTAPTGTTP